MDTDTEHEGVESSNLSDENIDILIDYVRSVSTTLLSAKSSDLDDLLTEGNLQRGVYRSCLQFALDSNPHVLFIIKERDDLGENKENENNHDDQEKQLQTRTHKFSYKIDSRLAFSTKISSIVAIIKRPGALDMSANMTDQLQAVTLPSTTALDGSNPYEILHSMMHFAIAPYFDAYSRQSEVSEPAKKSTASSDGAIPTTRRKINDLETSFLNLQQNVDIPELILNLPPVIEAALEALPEGETPTASLIPSNYLSDLSLINSLQSVVNGWIRNIQSITRLSRDPYSGTATQEINFWLSTEVALQNVDHQLNSPGVLLTLDVLRHAKRFHATVSFLSDTGLKEAIELVQKYNQLMRDFPLEELQSATSLGLVERAIEDIFNHLNKKLRIVPYPIARALALVENFSRELNSTVVSLLTHERLMQLPYGSFKDIMKQTKSVFSTWDESVKEFVHVSREMMRKRSEKFIPIRFIAHHTATKDRLQYLQTFRESHEELSRTINKVASSSRKLNSATVSSLALDNSDPLEEINEAYKTVLNVDVLDTSEEGIRGWNRAERKYTDRTTGVEQAIIAMLRDRLATARNSNEMFLVFSTFNPLFSRPPIRGAVQEYQSRLIENVKSDITSLQNRYRQQYNNSEAYEMAKMRDIPPVSGTIIWVKQMEYQLDTYIRRVQNILGEDWQQYADGKKLAAESASFRSKLDSQSIFENWLSTVTKHKISVNGFLFRIRNQRSSFSINVNFDPNIAVLFKEVRILQSNGFQIPHLVSGSAKSAKEVYHYALGLIDALNTLKRSLDLVESRALFAEQLLFTLENSVFQLLAKGIPLRWESLAHAYISNYDNGENRHVKFVHDFQTSVLSFSTSADDTVALMDRINQQLTLLRDPRVVSITYLTGIMGELQEYIDATNLGSFSNVGWFVDELNQEIQKIMTTRCKDIISSWIKLITGEEADASKLPVPPEIFLHELGLRNQVISLQPPLNRSKIQLLANLQKNLVRICRLQRLDAFRYELKAGEHHSYDESSRFYGITQSIADDLLHAYTVVDSLLTECDTYLETWYQFQALWDVEADGVYEILGSDMEKWLRILGEIRKARDTFDTNEPFRMVGIVKMDFQPIQIRINSKYDIWQHDIILKFSQRLNAEMKDTCSEMESHRRDLENQALDISSTETLVKCITAIQLCSANINLWEKRVNIFRHGQQTLSRHRFQFPAKWLFIEQVESEWAALQEILLRRQQTMELQSDAIRSKIDSEIIRASERINRLEESWQLEKPVSGSAKPRDALNILKRFSEEGGLISNSAEMLRKAAKSLSLDFEIPSSLNMVQEEIQDLSSVWGALESVWAALNDLREIPWVMVVPRKTRQSLEEFSQTMRSMPARIRQYAAFQHIQAVLRNLTKANALIIDLKSDAVQERHWHSLFQQLVPKKRVEMNSLTLGDVWDLNLIVNASIVSDMVTEAQGELALENFLGQVRETWSTYTLDLVNYKNICRLIRGWDDMFQKCTDHLNSLTAMHHSPYFRVFEEEARVWEEKINKINALFDVWLDVQRQWVYLEGVFVNSGDIKHILPVESARFQNINSEFTLILRTVYKSPLVLDVLNIPGIQESIERLADLLGRIQKALGSYFEQERQRFGRFYFIGDEDLLEIIGNPGDISRANAHLPKMFPGISGVLSDNSFIKGVRSREGEEMLFESPIALATSPKMVEWLNDLEHQTMLSVSFWLKRAREDLKKLDIDDESFRQKFEIWINRHPAQCLLLAFQCCWTEGVERELKSSLDSFSITLSKILLVLAEIVLKQTDGLTRRKCESLITELIHEVSILSLLVKNNVSSLDDFSWLKQMRFYYNENASPLESLIVRQADAEISYGFEYLGVPDKLINTPLVDGCFLTMTQALNQGLGGSPFGPAGTGKTESIKALGQALGRFVVVFCCDEYFDYQSIGRILMGICKIGAWGCFDEFNRLNDHILSAVSSQLETIGIGMTQTETTEIELIGRKVELHDHTGVFITMNPQYAGRNDLPDNLTRLFRSFSMARPDKELIAEAVLYSQGFVHAKALAGVIVPFFNRLSQYLSKQNHYDFGLRALKSVLSVSGTLKRRSIKNPTEPLTQTWESGVILHALHESVSPKLVSEDTPKLKNVEEEYFPGIRFSETGSEPLRDSIVKVAEDFGYIPAETWVEKIIQLDRFQEIHHGIMLVGQAGSGKSSVYKTLLKAKQELTSVESVVHCLDAKVLSKSALYGSLDSTTREWTDGLFTKILRKIVENLRGEQQKRHWIVFDGDVDPEWVENLNSVLDDNRMLTLPSGERIALPDCVRLIFEVDSLKYATPATVTRCGMIWFGDDVIDYDLVFKYNLHKIEVTQWDELYEDAVVSSSSYQKKSSLLFGQVAVIVRDLIDKDTLGAIVERSRAVAHLMEFNAMQAIEALFSLIKASFGTLVKNSSESDLIVTNEVCQEYMSRKILLNLVWAFAGDCTLKDRQTFGIFLQKIPKLGQWAAPVELELLDHDVSADTGNWISLIGLVKPITLESHEILSTDLVVSTIDTERHESLIYSYLNDHKPIILCGPPGSGKTMTLFSSLRKLGNLDVVGLNFSKETTPRLLIQSLEQYCQYRRTNNGYVLSPVQLGRWLVVFCDEVNLPAMDKYGSQKVIDLMRQMIEHGGFWNESTKQWVELSNIQFVGACNPPTDVGRNPMASRFLRHAAVVLVDYPGEISLHQIYETFNNALLKTVPSLRGHGKDLTTAMISVYLASQQKFTANKYSHYIYSPRELTRWCRGIYGAVEPLEYLGINELVRIWAHEGLRLFGDRLVETQEKIWTEELIDSTARSCFPGCDTSIALKRPILYSNWLSRHYVPIAQAELHKFVTARMKTFCEEEVDVPLILYDDLLDHVLRIDRVLRQPQGHLILIGPSTSGRTTLTRFVAWMNGIKVHQLKTTRNYHYEDFASDLRNILKRTGCYGEKICLIMDESNILETSFLERMNTLLANGEVPGLFEADDYTMLLTACREGASRQELNLSTEDELYRWFTSEIVRNLHVVFTMNPIEADISSRATTSPALFNRCVLNWMGDWSGKALYQVGEALAATVDVDKSDYIAPANVKLASLDLQPYKTFRESVINFMVSAHFSAVEIAKSPEFQISVTPGIYMEFVKSFATIFREKREALEKQQRHFNVGLIKLRDTTITVREFKISLNEKKSQLELKSRQANDMLRQMLADQNEAERKKVASIEIQGQLDMKEKEIAARQEVVYRDLATAEPAVLEAQKSVNNIKKQHLTELRSMVHPPEAVKLTLESVCVLLGNDVRTWREVQQQVRREDFIPSIVNFDGGIQMSLQLREYMENHYLALPNFNYETVNRASKACGPLLQWVEAQVAYSTILQRVSPLRDEVKQLEDEAEETKAQVEVIKDMIDELELSIQRYSDEYANLITETQSIKTEMLLVETKVDRSVSLLEKLSSEKQRWTESIKKFDATKDYLPGTCLLSAAFISYGGYFDQQTRRHLMNLWTLNLDEAGIFFEYSDNISNFLSTVGERLSWHDNGLPTDDLCLENAIILKRAVQYPYIIDPTGRSTEFLQNEFEGKLKITSFSDSSFVKHLESALRFGTPILIEDAEYLDPVIVSVLTREYKKTGGRTLIDLGKQEIDFSHNFKLFLVSGDPAVAVPSHIASRTTLVNFTITRNNLESQTLNRILQIERPDVEKERTELAKLQSEYKVHLFQLELDLLKSLNESEGSILDNDSIIETLERIKLEAGEINTKVSETESVMATIEVTLQTYQPLAASCSKIFLAIEKLSTIQSIYQFSLEYLLYIFDRVLKIPAEAASPQKRVEQLVKALYVEVFKHVHTTLLDNDIPMLALTFILLYSQPSAKVSEALMDNTTLIDTNTEGWLESFAHKLSIALPSCGEEELLRLITDGDDISQYFESSSAALAVVKQVSPHKVLYYIDIISKDLFESSLVYNEMPLEAVIDEAGSSPIALYTTAGNDPTSKIGLLLDKSRKHLVTIAMGTLEGQQQAEKFIHEGGHSGVWVLLQNIHMAYGWLETLEKRLRASVFHKDFRLLFTVDLKSHMPNTLMRMCRIVTIERPNGVKSSMQANFSALPIERISSEPLEKARLYFVLSWIHSIFKERLRFIPSGWSKSYSFDDSDFEFGLTIIDNWLRKCCGARKNIAPNSIPWDALRQLVQLTVYGGKIDTSSDRTIVDEYVQRLLVPKIFDIDFSLSQLEGPKMPEDASAQGLVSWIENLPEKDSPTWLGLSADAEIEMLVAQGNGVMRNANLMIERLGTI